MRTMAALLVILTLGAVSADAGDEQGFAIVRDGHVHQEFDGAVLSVDFDVKTREEVVEVVHRPGDASAGSYGFPGSILEFELFARTPAGASLPVTDAVVVFAVPADAVADPEGVVLVQGGAAWRPTPTTLLRSEIQRHVYEAKIGTLGRFVAASDTEAALLAGATPRNGSFVRDASEVSVFLVDDWSSDLKDPEAWIDGEARPVRAEDARLVFDGTDLEGTHDVRVTVADAAGRITALQWTFVLDTTPPEVEVTVDGHDLDITWADAYGVDLDAIKIIVGDVSFKPDARADGAQVQLKVDGSVRVEVPDLAGNVASKTVEVTTSGFDWQTSTLWLVAGLVPLVGTVVVLRRRRRGPRIQRKAAPRVQASSTRCDLCLGAFKGPYDVHACSCGGSRVHTACHLRAGACQACGGREGFEETTLP